MASPSAKHHIPSSTACRFRQERFYDPGKQGLGTSVVRQNDDAALVLLDTNPGIACRIVVAALLKSGTMRADEGHDAQPRRQVPVTLFRRGERL